MKRLLPIAILTAILVGCGNDGAAEPAPANNNEAIIQEAETEVVSNDQAVRHLTKALDAKPDSLGVALNYEAQGASDACSLILILTTPAEIQLYEDAGDAIIKNPSGSVGVKLSTTAADRAACMRAAAKALESL